MPSYALEGPKSRTQSTGRSFTHIAVKMWNGLPENIVGEIEQPRSSVLQELHTQVPFTITDDILSCHGFFVYNFS